MRQVKKSKIDVLRKKLEDINRGKWKASPEEVFVIKNKIIKLMAAEKKVKK